MQDKQLEPMTSRDVETPTNSPTKEEESRRGRREYQQEYQRVYQQEYQQIMKESKYQREKQRVEKEKRKETKQRCCKGRGNLEEEIADHKTIMSSKYECATSFYREYQRDGEDKEESRYGHDHDTHEVDPDYHCNHLHQDSGKTMRKRARKRNKPQT